MWLRFFSVNICVNSGVFVLSQDLVMDILRVLSTPDLEVRKKTLQLALDLVSSRNVEEVKQNSERKHCCKLSGQTWYNSHLTFIWFSSWLLF